MQFVTGISRNNHANSCMLSLFECVWDFQNNRLCGLLINLPNLNNAAILITLRSKSALLRLIYDKHRNEYILSIRTNTHHTRLILWTPEADSFLLLANNQSDQSLNSHTYIQPGNKKWKFSSKSEASTYPGLLIQTACEYSYPWENRQLPNRAC